MTTCPACSSAAPEGSRFCPACGTELAAAGAVVSERKLATILFADVVGSTSSASAEDPERVHARLQRFYDAMTEEIERAGGTVEKFAGDAVMAVFGVPSALEDHAERALHTGLALHRRVGELFDGSLELRVGVNTGEVVIGRPREGSALVSGDAVNVAARLEQAAGPGEVLAGQRTVQAARGAFEFGEETLVDAKGKPTPVPCRRLVRALSLMRPRGLLGRQARLVGRERELELLQATYRRAAEHHEAHLVTLIGDVGVGKTRIVRELWDWLAAEPLAPSRRTGRCLPYGTNAYWALGEVLKEQLGLLDGETPDSVHQRLGGRAILGLSLGLDTAGGLHPLAARERLHEAWVELLTELAAERPVVVLVEDLHWAEEPLLDLLDRVARDVRGPLLLLATTRPELLQDRPSWGAGRRNASLLWVDALSQEQTVAIVADLLPHDLPAGLLDAILSRADGNPFFVEELVGALIDEGVLERDSGGWTARADARDVVVPDSVQAVVAGRIDLLPSAEKAALQAAAVIGRVFWAGPVVELLGGDEPDFALLEDRDFIRRRSGSSIAGEREFAIKHAVTREVAYASVPKARRARLHASFAGWLKRFAGGRDELVDVLAHHYAEAVRAEDRDLAWAGEEAELELLRARAVDALRRAGQLAVGRYEIEEGVAQLTRAAELTGDAALRALLWREVGLANAQGFDGEAFWTAMQRSLEECPDSASRGDAYGLLAFHTAARSGMWRSRPDRAAVNGWVDRALELSEPESAARARALIARSFTGQRGGRGAPSAAAEASAIADRLGDAELRSYAWDALAAEAFDTRSFGEALAWSERRLTLADEISDPDHIVDLDATPVPYYAAFGRFEEARAMARRSDEVASRLSDHHRVHGVSILLELEELLGEWGRVVDLQARTEASVEANLATPCIRNMRSLLLCAVASAEQGRGGEAHTLEAQADSLAMTGFDHVLCAPRTRLALARGDHERLEELVEQPFDFEASWYGMAQHAARMDLLAAIRATERAEEEAPTHLQPGTYLEPFALRALGVVRQDETLLERADRCFAALGLTWHASQTERLLAIG